MPDAQLGLRTPSFTYTLRQIASRDEIVFKSVVRVLQGKTRHVWQHTDGADANLFVLGTQASGEPSRPADSAGHVVIQVSASAGTDFHGLTLPLRIADVISHLDQAGDEIASRAARPAGPEAVSAPAPVLFNQRVSLTRWPEPALLQRDVRYLKLATALTGQPVNLTELADRTQFPLVVCQTFVEAMKAVGLLRVMDEVREAPSQAYAVAPAAHRHKHPLVEHLGLIARIRSRLEMLVRTPAAK